MVTEMVMPTRDLPALEVHTVSHHHQEGFLEAGLQMLLEGGIGVEGGMMVWQAQLLRYARDPIKVIVGVLQKVKAHPRSC
ncbi:hypothetical protein VNO77_10200 [Canavalia gladiata]|uniref:Uncharacterized protein n=1 Tax=Canavalia gladiata TaxID=3824 RepID=A0AAN9MFL7_CANGL